MGFLGLLQFALKHFDVLAWPLFALVYPLCSSIRAIETNSISDTQKLNTYWVVFSLVLLFENTFMKLLERLPLWPYIRLMVVVWLVIPHFDGAFYVYKHLICPCLSMDPQIVANWFNKQKDTLFMRENFLAEVDRYVKENGPEALENIVACKSETTSSELDMKDFRAVSSTENTEVSQAEPNLTETKNFRFGTMEIIEVAADREILKTPPLETKEKAVEVATGREVLESSKNVQKEWTCALCQMTTTCEKNLNMHLEGRQHKAAYEALKAKNQAFVPKTSPASTAKKSDQCNEEPADGVSTNGLKRNIVITFEEKVQGQKQNPKEVPTMQNSSRRCNICNVRCLGEIDMASHLKGRKHEEKVREVIRKNDPLGLNPLWCKVCKVSCNSEFDMASHLKGRKHLDNPLWCKICNVSCSSEIDMASHLNGRKHLDNPLWCKICNVSCSSKLNMASHLIGRKHLDNLSAGM